MRRMHRKFWLPWLLPTLGLAAMLLTGLGLSDTIALGGRGTAVGAFSAQTDDVVPPLPRPAYLYSGRCGELEAVAWPINSLVAPNGIARGSGAIDRAENSFTANVPISIDLMLSGSYAVNVHESGENVESVLSCGNIGGVTDGVGNLIIGLRQQRGSGVTGIAVLSPSPVDPAMTYISVFITGAALGDEVGTIMPTVVPAADVSLPADEAPPVNPGPVDVGPGPTGDDDDGGDDDDDGGDD